MSDILSKIIISKHQEVVLAKQNVPLAQLREQIYKQTPVRGFAKAIQNKVNQMQSAVIAEIKKASPSKGVIRNPFYPAAIAASYEEGGASCLSVLTDEQYFQGSPDYLKQARAACRLPVLRKDFMVDDYQLYEARAMGADAILLIAAALSLEQMHSLEKTALSLELDVLVEVHNEVELCAALTLQTPLLGINNRNLKTFEVSLQNTYELLAKIPNNKCIITESGIMTTDDVKAMKAHHVHAFLVGEVFMRADEPGQALKAMFG